MNRLCIIFIFYMYIMSLHGQTPFSILPDVGGINKQAMGLLGLTDSNDIIIIGHRYDTLLPGPNTKPYLARFTYEGNLNETAPIIDTLYDEPFNIPNSATLEKKNDSIYYFRAQRDIGDPYYQNYLMEINTKSGEVYRSRLIINADSSLLYYDGGFINYFDTNKMLLLVNTLHKEDSLITYLTFLDSLLNQIRVVKVKEVSEKTLAISCKLNLDDSFIIVGSCLVENGAQDDFYSFYLDYVGGNGDVLVHSLAPTSVPISRDIYGTNTVLHDIEGNWIIAGSYHKDLANVCVGCSQYIPYIFSTTPDFKTLRWETRIFDGPENGFSPYSLYSICQVNDGYVVSGDYSDENGINNGILFKVSKAGDSLWLKHYVPLDWEQDRVAWVRFNDIQTSPYGTMVVVGTIGDLQENIIRPWILHLDKDGCLVPGCNTVSTEDHRNNPLEDNFTIYPNPASSEIYVLSHVTNNNPVQISIVSNDGLEIKNRSFDPVSGYQYVLSVSDLKSGLYYLVVTDQRSGRAESHQFVRQ